MAQIYPHVAMPETTTAMDMVGREPRGVAAALACPILGTAWADAMNKEMNQLVSMGVFQRDATV